MCRTLLFALAGYVVLTGRSANAAGIEFPDIGALSVGRGGAVAARPTGGTAVQVNPAGLSSQAGLHVSADARVAWQQVRFDAANDGSASNSAMPYIVPDFLVASFGFGPTWGLSALTVALGVTAPSAVGSLTYPSDGPQRYNLVSSDYLVAYYSAAVAARLTQWLAAGVTLQLVQAKAKFVQAVRPLTGDDLVSDSLATVDTLSGLTPTAVIGASFTPHPACTVGISYRPHLRIAAGGTVSAQLPPVAQALEAYQQGDQATLRLPLPDVVRLGVEVQPLAGLQVEVDVVYEGWSIFRQLEVQTHDVVIGSKLTHIEKSLPNLIYPKNMHDAVSGRFGIDYELLPERLSVRAGYLYETSAIPSSTVGVEFPNWGRQALSAGVTLSLWGAFVDVGYAHHFVPTQIVRNGQDEQQVTPSLLPGLSDPTPTIINNGTYHAALDILAIGLRVPLQALHSLL